LVEAQG